MLIHDVEILPGDTLIWTATGAEMKVLGFPAVNGRPGVFVDPGDRFAMANERLLDQAFVAREIEAKRLKVKTAGAVVVRRAADQPKAPRPKADEARPVWSTEDRR